jgi:hypothetical protein
VDGHPPGHPAIPPFTHVSPPTRLRANDIATQEAIHRLRNYVPPPTAYDTVPLSRRAAVLLLLYADPQGDLRIVITIRAKTLRSCRYLPKRKTKTKKKKDQPCFQVCAADAARHAPLG